MRLFVSINLDDITKEKLSGVINSFKGSLSVGSLKAIRWEAVKKIHLTLFFIGESPERKLANIKRSLQEAVENFKGGVISLKTTSIGAFPNLKKPRVFFFSLEGEAGKLMDLQKLVSKNLSSIGFRQDKKFNPHLTFARVKIPKFQLSEDLHKLTSELKFDIKFDVNKVSLMKSTLKSGGSVHEEVEGWEI